MAKKKRKNVSKQIEKDDLVILDIGKDDFQRCNITPLATSLEACYSGGVKKVAIFSMDYDSDPREMWEIPEVCTYVNRLINEYPQWIRYASEQSLWILWCAFFREQEIRVDVSRLFHMMNTCIDVYTPESERQALDRHFEQIYRNHIEPGFGPKH